MKKYFLLLALITLSVAGISQPDLQNYYAASRYDYYTTEKTGHVLVYVPESKKGMNITVDMVLDFSFLNRGIPVFPGHAIPVSFELERFKLGNNEVTVSFYENEKWIDSRKINVILRPGTFNEVKCDLLSGCLVTDGHPFFPVGFYCQWPVFHSLPEEEAVKGFNLMSPYWNIDSKGRKDRIKFMDRCAGLGMKVNYNVCNVAAGGLFTGTKGSLTKEEKLELLEKEVIALRDHPALLAWYLYDEPEGQGVPPDSLQAAYDLIKKLDPYHPVTIVFMAPHMADKYRNVMDIAMTDPYPVPNGPILQVEEYVEILNGFFRYQKPVWVVPQAFGGNEWWTREPDPREVRAMTYLGLIHHASGIQYFIRKGLNGSPKSQAVWGECGSMAQEIMELLPSLASGQPAPPVIPSKREIQARAINKNGMFTIMVVNISNKPLEFSMKVEDIGLTMDIDVLFEGRKIPMTDGNFSDIIDAYGTRFYRIDNRMKPDWQKDLKPGNLTIDPGFENIANAATPAACYGTPGTDRGATFFLDGRVYRQGDHSLRLLTPAENQGAKLSFFGLELSPDKSYTCSVWAKREMDFSPREFIEHEIEIPDIEPDMMMEKEMSVQKPEDKTDEESEFQKPGKRDKKQMSSQKTKAMTFELSLGADHEKQFNLTEDWTEYSFTTAGQQVRPSLARWSMPGLELKSAGTAWFDVIQVVADMEIVQSSKFKVQSGGIEIELRSVFPDAMITYTLDGSEPTALSKAYDGPFVLDKSAVVKAAAFRNNQLVGTIRGAYTIHKAIGAGVNYITSYEQYEGGGKQGLVDGIMATDNYKDGRWQGFHGKDAIFVVDLGSVQSIRDIRLNFLQDISVWIFLPADVEISFSEDGISYQTAGKISHDIPLDKRGALIHEFKAVFSSSKARYIKIEAKSTGTCPAWHSGAGQPGWIFLDEVVID